MVDDSSEILLEMEVLREDCIYQIEVCCHIFDICNLLVLCPVSVL